MNFFGNKIRLTIFGESHGAAIGCVLEGLPAGERLDRKALEAFLRKRAPGQDSLATGRQEEDMPEFLSGIRDGVLTGAALCAILRNNDARPGDYAKLKDIPRPGHADYPAFVKYHGHNDIRGGGSFSGRLTAPLCVAGGILLQLLERRGIFIGAHIAQIADVGDTLFDPVKVSRTVLKRVYNKPFPVLCKASGEAMRATVEEARRIGDSVGGVVETAIVGLPAGVGEPMFGGLENRLSQAVFAIPAVKGISFGDGFYASCLLGSQNNDPYLLDEHGEVRTLTNHCGGILGGLSTGMPVLFRAAFKPTPSIAQPQQSISLSKKCPETLVVRGRHDPCIVLRAVPAVMAAAALAIYDSLP